MIRIVVFIAAATAMGLGWVFSTALLAAGFVLFLVGMAIDLADPTHSSHRASDELAQERAAQAALRPRSGVVDHVTPTGGPH